MKKILAASLLTLFAALAGPRAFAAVAEQQVQKSIDLDRGATCELTNISGNMVVRPAPGRRALLTAVIRAHALTEAGARQTLSHVHVDISADEHGLRAAEVHDRNSGDHSADVNYTLELPSGVALKLKTVSGDLDVTGADAGLEAHGVSGELRASRTSGELKLQTVSGAMKLTDISGRWSLKTVSGDIKLSLIGQSPGEAQTVSGNVDIVADKNANLAVQTSTLSGSIRNMFPGQGDTPLRIKTLSGNIQIAKR